MILSAASAWAAFGEDLEKPQPLFSRAASDWDARLIPRGKSTSVLIRFQSNAATITTVETAEFPDDQQPDLDIKDFRSGFFKVNLKAEKPGGEAGLILSSDCFTTSTQLWGGDPKKKDSWKDLMGTVERLPDRVKTLGISVRDGGPLDTDGAADGRIELIVAPRDSFWGYAIGTLFIRFFGVFIVLGVLMIGMQLSGLIFRHIESRNPPNENDLAQGTSSNQPAAVSEPIAPAAHMETTAVQAASPEVAVAIALALHLRAGEVAAAITLALHLHAGSEQHPAGRITAPSASRPRETRTSAWVLSGRSKLMADRLRPFDRIHLQPVRTNK